MVRLPNHHLEQCCEFKGQQIGIFWWVPGSKCGSDALLGALVAFSLQPGKKRGTRSLRRESLRICSAIYDLRWLFFRFQNRHTLQVNHLDLEYYIVLDSNNKRPCYWFMHFLYIFYHCFKVDSLYLWKKVCCKTVYHVTLSAASYVRCLPCLLIA